MESVRVSRRALRSHMLSGKHRRTARMKHSLSFELRGDGIWFIYLHGRDSPIGEIEPVPAGGWYGQMNLDGYAVSECGPTPQIVIDAFKAWVAAGTPADSPLRDQL